MFINRHAPERTHLDANENNYCLKIFFYYILVGVVALVAVEVVHGFLVPFDLPLQPSGHSNNEN